MKNEDTISLSGHYVEVASQDLPSGAGSADNVRMQPPGFWEKLSRYFKGGNDASPAPDPALAIINEIPDHQVRMLVKELHYLTPPSLKTMREACESCFFLPENCSYFDYSIPDVNKAIKRINSHPALSASPGRVVRELARVNGELARHLRDHFDLEEEEK
jgi:hypothetical protein